MPKVLGFVFVWLVSFSLAHASTGESFSFYIENDSRNVGGPGTDESYSNGFRFSYVYAQGRVPAWAPIFQRAKPKMRETLERSPTNFGISVAHQIFTPDDTQTTTLIEKDRPYAGYLSVGFSATLQIEDTCELLAVDVGTIGPAAMGPKIQNGFHRVLGVPDAEGWDNQLKNEPTLQLSYQRRERLYELRVRNSKNADVIPFAGVGLGNVLVGAHIGLIARAGVNVPDDFGPSRPSATDGDAFTAPREEAAMKGWGLYAFGGVRGNAVAHNLFLDGNTFQSSHSVTRNTWVGEVESGFGVQYDKMSLVWRYVTRTPEFTENTRTDSFASISISYYRGLD